MFSKLHLDSFRSEDGGFIKIILLFVAIVVLFAYFGINFRETIAAINKFLAAHPEIVVFFQFIWNVVLVAWSDYVNPALMWIWGKINFFFA